MSLPFVHERSFVSLLAPVRHMSRFLTCKTLRSTNDTDGTEIEKRFQRASHRLVAKPDVRDIVARFDYQAERFSENTRANGKFAVWMSTAQFSIYRALTVLVHHLPPEFWTESSRESTGQTSEMRVSARIPDNMPDDAVVDASFAMLYSIHRLSHTRHASTVCARAVCMCVLLPLRK